MKETDGQTYYNRQTYRQTDRYNGMRQSRDNYTLHLNAPRDKTTEKLSPKRNAKRIWKRVKRPTCT